MRTSIRTGFSLMEVIVALSLVGVLSLVVFANWAVSLRTQATDARYIRAKGAAERTVMEALGRPCEWVNDPLDQPRIGTLEDEGMRYSRETDVRPLPGSNLWRFKATVSWVMFGRRYSTSVLMHQDLPVICPQWMQR